MNTIVLFRDDKHIHRQRFRRLACHFALKEKIHMNMIKNILTLMLMAAPFLISAQSIENRNPGSFDGLKVSGSFQTTVRHGDAPAVKIEAEGVETNAIITEINDNTLSVHMKNGDYRNIKVRILITYTALRSISNSGSGKLICESSIDAKEFNLGSSGSGGLVVKENIKAGKLHMGVSGSGSVQVNGVTTDDMHVGISGSGGLHIENGKADHLAVELAGSGGFKAFGLTASNANISLAGSGGAEISVEDTLNGNIAGSGNISYKGNPGNISTHTAGSGRMRKI